jgi:hypothetical protein
MPSTDESFKDGWRASLSKSTGFICYLDAVLEGHKSLQYPVFCAGIEKLLISQQCKVQQRGSVQCGLREQVSSLEVALSSDNPRTMVVVVGDSIAE